MNKRNKRQKAWVGAAISAIGSLLSAGIGAYSTSEQIAAQQRSIKAQEDAMRRNANAENASILQSNLQDLANAEEDPRSRVIPTQTSALKLGGRRCKKNGGRLMKFI